MIDSHEGYTAMRERENTRRLARYDEAICLLREVAPAMDLISFELSERVDAFLATEPAPEKGRGE